ncbi:MAG: family 20 glycosylhydrolase [Planctomycetaceae bacterium]
MRNLVLAVFGAGATFVLFGCEPSKNVVDEAGSQNVFEAAGVEVPQDATAINQNLAEFKPQATVAKPGPRRLLFIEWIHDENIPGPKNAATSYDYIVNSATIGRLVLRPDLSKPQPSPVLPASGWAIYFSVGDFMDIDQKHFRENNPTLKLTFSGIQCRYKIEPGEGFKPLEGLDPLEIKYRGNRITMVTSDRPAGFYLVSVDKDGKETVESDIPVAYGPIAKFQPVPDPVGAQMTTAARYERYAKNAAQAKPQLVLPLPKKVTVDADRSIPLVQLGPVKFPVELKFEGELAEQLVLWFSIESNQDPAYPIVLSIDPQLGREEYRLSVDAAIHIDNRGVRIIGGSPAGVFYGVQTLSQLMERSLKNGRLPLVTIEDSPELGHRGLMIDICRHFYGPHMMKRVIDQMARYKLNVLQLHLNDDEGWRIEIPALPELTQIGSRRGHQVHDANGKVQMLPVVFDDGAKGAEGYFTRDEYIELVKYADQRHIEVIPEIDVPGHSRSAIQALKDKPGYQLIDPADKSVHVSPQGFTDNILNPAMDGVYTFIEDVFKGLNEMHAAAGVPLKRVHIGGDETPVEAWTLSPACAAKGYENVDPKQDKQKAEAVHKQIRMDFSKKLYDIIDRAVSDKVVIGCWHDNVPFILDRMAAGRAFMTDWDINGEEGYKRIRAGQPTVLCNPRFTYYDMIYELDPSERGHFWSGATDTIKAYGYRPFGLTDKPLDMSERKNVLGLQAQIWTETVITPEMFEMYLMPRLLAFCERAWNPDVSEADVQKNWPGFAAYVGQVALPTLDRSKFRYHVPKPGAINDNGRVKALVPFPGLAIRYTINGSEPNTKSKLYNPAEPPEFDAKIKLRAFSRGGAAGTTVSLSEE